MKNGSENIENGSVQDASLPPEDQRKRALSALQNSKAFADITKILVKSPTHRHYFIADLEWLVVPALALGQFRIFYDQSEPMAFVLWAKLSEDAEKNVLLHGARMHPSDWHSGDRIWVIDIVGPGPSNSKLYQQILAELAKKVFEGQNFKMPVRDPKSGKRRTVVFGPKSASKDIEAAAEGKAIETLQ